MNKRDPSSDVPRRIYASTIDRIDKHLNTRPREFKKSKRKGVKGDFNKFLISMLDAYEFLQTAPIKYIYDNAVYDSPDEIRGHAIRRAAKTKKPVQWPEIAIIIGDDEN